MSATTSPIRTARATPSSSPRAIRSRREYVDQVPPVFETRVLSLRGFDGDGMMAEAILTQPGEADAGIRKLFANPEIATHPRPQCDARMLFRRESKGTDMATLASADSCA